MTTHFEDVPLPSLDSAAPRDEDKDGANVPPQHDAVAIAVADLLTALGVDEGDHTRETPTRVAKAWRHMLGGYDEEPADHLDKTFSAPRVPGLVCVEGIPVRTTCAHHMLPITGKATVAYLPSQGQNVVGLSKLSRLFEGYARRLQVQEQLGYQVVSALWTRLLPVGAACVITAEHGCMTLRGVQQHGTVTTTVATDGAWSDDPGDPVLAMVLARHNASLLR